MLVVAQAVAGEAIDILCMYVVGDDALRWCLKGPVDMKSDRSRRQMGGLMNQSID